VMAGPRSEPPMPILTTSLMRLPFAVAMAPERTPVAKSHLAEDAVDVGHHVLAVDADRPVRAVAQRHMQHGAPFGDVDGIALEPPLAQALDVPRLGEFVAQVHGLGGHGAFRPVE